MEATPLTEASAPAPGRLAEAAALEWRRALSERTLVRYERLWTAWTAGVVVVFLAPAALLLSLSPWTFPVAALCVAHAWGITWLYARRGAASVVPMGSERSAASSAESDPGAEHVALGLLGDLVAHDERGLLSRTGLALHRGALGVWLVGERGALLVRPGGRRIDGWCVRVADTDGLPAGDRVAHLLLALREDEIGFATVANFDYSGALWRIRRRLPQRSREAVDAARAIARRAT